MLYNLEARSRKRDHGLPTMCFPNFVSFRKDFGFFIVIPGFAKQIKTFIYLFFSYAMMLYKANSTAAQQVFALIVKVSI